MYMAGAFAAERLACSGRGGEALVAFRKRQVERGSLSDDTAR